MVSRNMEGCRKEKKSEMFTSLEIGRSVEAKIVGKQLIGESCFPLGAMGHF